MGDICLRGPLIFAFPNLSQVQPLVIRVIPVPCPGDRGQLRADFEAVVAARSGGAESQGLDVNDGFRCAQCCGLKKGWMGGSTTCSGPQ